MSSHAGSGLSPGSPGARVSALLPWVRITQPAPAARVVLLCFPHAGGGASAFHRWPSALAERGIEVWPVQPPGRETRHGEPAMTDLAALTTTLVGFLAEHLTGRPYALYGHSAGASVAYAFALRAAAHRVPGPVHLFVGASRPLSHPDPDFPIHRLAPEPFLAKLRSYGGLPAEALAYPELVETMLATARADLRLVETHGWRDDRKLDCPVTAVGGVADREVPVELLPAWQAITRGPFDVAMLPGGHFPPPAAQRTLMEVLARALN